MSQQPSVNTKRMVPSEDELSAFLYLLRTSLWGKSSANEPLPDLTRLRANVLWQLAEEQTVLGHLAEALQMLYGNNLPAEYSLRNVQIAAKLLKEHQMLNNRIHKTFDFLKDQGFAPILLKGQGNAVRYREPLLRQCGDIDIYIGKQDYKRACECIGKLVGEEAVNKSEWCPKHMHVNDGKVSIELHRIAEQMAHPLVNARFQRLTQYWMQPTMADIISVNGYDVHVPARQFNVLYVFNHLWHHFISKGIGLRQLCDWCMILHEAAGKIDLKELESDLRHLHLLRGWQIMAHITVEKLGLCPNEMPFYTAKYHVQAERVWQMILAGGNFGKYDERRKSMREKYLERKCKSFLYQHKITYRIMSVSPEDALTYYFFFLGNGFRRVLSDQLQKLQLL